jgi:hypothetical protein
MVQLSYSFNKMQNNLMLNHVVLMVTTELQRVNFDVMQ